MQNSLLAVAVAACFALAGCSDSRRLESLSSPSYSQSGGQQTGAVQPPAQTITPVEDGRRIFLENCTPCHGKNADAQTPAGRTWKVPDLRSERVQSLSNAQLQQIIREGKGKMPPWNGILSQAEIDVLTAYIRSLGAGKTEPRINTDLRGSLPKSDSSARF
ncbi:MAG: cytochrome c [Terriglobales bacterium]